MKKPINKIALALWILAVLFAAIEIWTGVSEYRALAGIRGTENYYLVGGSIPRIVQSIVGVTAMLVALGTLIELVDQIRWTIVRAVEKK